MPTAGQVIRFKMPPDQHRSTVCDNITCGEGPNHAPRWEDVEWSPDSKTLAFVSTSRDHKDEKLRVADAATGESTKSTMRNPPRSLNQVTTAPTGATSPNPMSSSGTPSARTGADSISTISALASSKTPSPPAISTSLRFFALTLTLGKFGSLRLAASLAKILTSSTTIASTSTAAI